MNGNGPLPNIILIITDQQRQVPLKWSAVRD